MISAVSILLFLSPRNIGNGNPGKNAFFQSILKVKYAPAKMPTIEIMHGITS